MVGGELGAVLEQGVLIDAELDKLRLGLDLGLAEMAALGLTQILRLGRAGAELHAIIAVAALLAAGDHLQILERQYGDGHMAAVILEQAGHSHLLRDHAGAHDQSFLSEAHGEAAGVNSPKHMHHPAWAVFPAEAEMRGTQTTARAVRYPFVFTVYRRRP